VTNLPVALLLCLDWTTTAARRTGGLKNRRKLSMVVAGKIVDSSQTLQMSTSTGGNHPPAGNQWVSRITPRKFHSKPNNNQAVAGTQEVVVTWSK
jgi:hypothetical protein